MMGVGAAGTSQYLPSSFLPDSRSAKAYGSSEWLLFAMATVARRPRLGWLTAEMFFVGLECRSSSAGLVSSAVSPP